MHKVADGISKEEYKSEIKDFVGKNGTCTVIFVRPSQIKTLNWKNINYDCVVIENMSKASLSSSLDFIATRNSKGYTVFFTKTEISREMTINAINQIQDLLSV